MGNVANIEVKPYDVSWGGSGVGFTDGDLELAFTEDLVDVTAHQEGTSILSAIRTGKNFEVSVTLKETSIVKLKQILGAAGTIDTASGGSAEVIGWGAGKDFTQVLDQAQKLVFHPVGKPDDELEEDVAFWKAYPVPGSLTASGENPNTYAVTFRCFPDFTKARKWRLGVIGDHETGSFNA